MCLPKDDPGIVTVTRGTHWYTQVHTGIRRYTCEYLASFAGSSILIRGHAY